MTAHRYEPIPAVVLHVLGVTLLIIAAAALVSLVAGCGGNVLYAERFTTEQLEPSANEWRALGAKIDIVYQTDPPAHADVITYVRHGYLQQVEGRGPDSCSYTKPGGPFSTHSIEIDVGCVDDGTFSLHDVAVHEFGHWLGLHHLPDSEVGIMSATGMPGGGEHHVTCADKRDWAAFSGTRADCGDQL